MPTLTPLPLQEIEKYSTIDPFFEFNPENGEVYRCDINRYGIIQRMYGHIAMPDITLEELRIAHAESPLYPSHLFFAYRSDAVLYYKTHIASVIEPNDLVFVNGIDENNRPEYVGRFGIVASTNGTDAFVLLHAPVGDEGAGGARFESRVLTKLMPTDTLVIDAGGYALRGASTQHTTGGA